MSEAAADSYADWKAPGEDGQTLIWPEPGQILKDAAENHRRLSSADGPRIQGVALAAVRRELRRWIGHDHDDQLLFATGHQTELRHPGVWAKDALIDAAAQKTSGAAYHFAVDTDEPKHLLIQWPGASWQITDDEKLASAAWCGLLETPTPEHIKNIRRSMEQSGAEGVLGHFLDSMRRLTLESNNLSAVVVNACHELDWSLGLRHHAMLVSPILRSRPYLLLVYHLLARGDKFAAQYNAALREYRQGHGIKSDSRPMPDLRVADDQCEAPFWLDDLRSGKRTRAKVVGGAGRWRLMLEGGEAFAFSELAEGWEAAEALGRWLVGHQLRLSPRALTLTLFLRLIAADQFVHGIGGGRYDQVLDRLIATHFGVEPPKFSVTTATLYHPEAAGRVRVCLPCIVQRGHRLKHGLLGEQKKALLGRIEALPRRSRERLAVFQEMHERLDAAEVNHPAMGQWRQNLDDAREQERRDEILFNRELFYAIQPRERLEGLIAQYRRQV